MAARLKRKGYDCKFVQSVPELFKCRACNLVLRDPHLTRCCGGNICLFCAEKDDHKCPLCGAGALVKSLNRRLREEIRQQNVYCHAKGEGCKWTGFLEKLDEHESKCGFICITCVCGESIQRKDETEHKKTCPRFIVTCHCGTEVERWCLTDHKKECALEFVKCPFHAVGCSVVVQNKALKTHFEEGLSSHIALVAKQTSEVQKQWEQAKMQREAKEKKMNETLDADIAMLTLSIVVANEKTAELATQLYLTENEVRQMEELTTRERNDFVRSNQASDMTLRDIEERMLTLRIEAQRKCFGQQLPRPPYISSRPTLPYQDEHLVPFTFMINNFNDLNAHDILQYSPPFYTYRRGYKMCLKVYCNGDSRAKGKFLSIYVQLLKGNYDHKLQWPFEGTFTVVVLNQLASNSSDVYHKSKTIAFNDSTDSTGVARSQVVSGYLAEEWIGFWNFMPLHLLFPGHSIFPSYKYVVNNSLKIQVSNFKSN